MKFREYLIKEDFLTGFKNMKKNVVEIFSNPDKKEMKDSMDKYGLRFIADGKNKNLYTWKATESLHSDAWSEIKKESGDSRNLYRSGELLTGQFKTKAVSDTAGFLSPDAREQLKSMDWSWMNKWFSVDDIVRKL